MIKRPLAPFGTEISGLDLAAVTPPLFAELALLIARSRVVVFRGQTLDDAAFVTFLRGLGPLTFTEGEKPVPNAPDLNIVSNVGRVTPPRSVFHTDTSYVTHPPAFTALRPVVLPATGGNTLFTDQVNAAARLPVAAWRFLTGQTVLHQTSGLAGQCEATRQPLLRRVVATGETALYLSTPERCTQLSGVDELTSQRIIAALYRHSTKASRLYRHEWQSDDILIWHNCVTMHKADHGHGGLTQDRVLHRGMVRGEACIKATQSR